MGEIAILYVSTFKQQRVIRFHCSVEVRTRTVRILCCPPPPPRPLQRKSQEFAYHVNAYPGAKESESVKFSLLYLLHPDQVQALQA